MQGVKVEDGLLVRVTRLGDSVATVGPLTVLVTRSMLHVNREGQANRGH